MKQTTSREYIKNKHDSSPIMSYKFYDWYLDAFYNVKTISYDSNKIPEQLLVYSLGNHKITKSVTMDKGELVPSTNLFGTNGIELTELYLGDIIKCPFENDELRVIIWDNGFRILGYTAQEFAKLAKHTTVVGSRYINTDGEKYKECLSLIK